MITDHVFRPTWANGPKQPNIPATERPCWYANCGRPRSEHARSVSLSRAVTS